MTDESWAVEEYVEDAIIAFLQSKIADGVLTYYPAWSDAKIKYPCVVVHAGESRNVEESEFNGMREIDVALGVMTEAVAVGGTSARHMNRKHRDAVINALAQDPLHTDLNNMNPDGVVFSMAMIDGVTRSVDGEKRVFVSEINLRVIAAAQAITTTTTAGL